MAASVEVRNIAIKKATPDALKKYGDFLGYNADVEPMPIDFYGGSVKVRRVAHFESATPTEMPVVTLQRRPMDVRYMERHFKHTQAFISLGSKPFVCAFAPPNDKDLPDLDQVEAFLFDGSAGFVMHIGTWHEFPFAVLDDTNLLVILTKEATDGLIKDNVVQDEAIGPDIEKKDLLRRKNVTFSLEL